MENLAGGEKKELPAMISLNKKGGMNNLVFYKYVGAGHGCLCSIISSRISVEIWTVCAMWS